VHAAGQAIAVEILFRYSGSGAGKRIATESAVRGRAEQARAGMAPKKPL